MKERVSLSVFQILPGKRWSAGIFSSLLCRLNRGGQSLEGLNEFEISPTFVLTFQATNLSSSN